MFSSVEACIIMSFSDVTQSRQKKKQKQKKGIRFCIYDMIMYYSSNEIIADKEAFSISFLSTTVCHMPFVMVFYLHVKQPKAFGSLKLFTFVLSI